MHVPAVSLGPVIPVLESQMQCFHDSGEQRADF